MSDGLISAHTLVRTAGRLLQDLATKTRAQMEKTLGKPATCRPNCAFCCYAKIVIDVPQGALIYLYLRPDWPEGFENELARADRELSAVRHDQWLLKMRPCVLLEEDERGQGRCRAYAARPFACAGTFSFDGDPALCARSDGQHLAMLDYDAAALAPFAEMYGSLRGDLRLKGDWLMTLPGAILYARAVIEGLPLPKVSKVDRGKCPEEQGLVRYFDKVTGR
jgi:Fe-S-cluster containining protein